MLAECDLFSASKRTERGRSQVGGVHGEELGGCQVRGSLPIISTSAKGAVPNAVQLSYQHSPGLAAGVQHG